MLNTIIDRQADIAPLRAFAILAMVANKIGGEPLLRTLVDEGRLLGDPDWQKPLGWSRLRKVYAAKEVEPAIAFPEEWWAKGSDAVFEEAFPARTKIDLAIRRSRSTDLWLHIRRFKLEGDMRKFLTKVHGTWDYIALLNIMWSVAVHGYMWGKRFADIGCLDAGVEHWDKTTKLFSNRIKMVGLQDVDWSTYVEAYNLSGYRNPPFPGFDVMKDAHDLAEGGQTPHAPAGVFEARCKELFVGTPQPRKWMSLADFVRSGSWVTSGASSEGRLEFELDGKSESVKCRKNTAVDVLSMDELVAIAEDHTVKQVNTTIIKSELGKLRLAVAADLRNYLRMSWIDYLLGDVYKGWGGNTLNEDIPEQTKRMVRMLKLVARCYGLPFDYLAFDHQITTQELKIILRIMCQLGETNVPAEHLLAYRHTVTQVLASFDEAVLIAKDGDIRRVFKVLGGLMSGLRWTSLLGYLWNKVQTSLAADTLAVFGIAEELVAAYIRGDDSAIFADSWQAISLIKLGYDMLRIKAGRGKFSVQKHGMEFLRVWYAERCFGYSCRAVPGLTQRKPWSSMPWSETSVLEAIYDVGRTLQRRGANGLAAYSSIAMRWCQLHRIPRPLLALPRALGGAGVEPWDGETYVTPALPRLERSDFKPLNQNNYRRDKWLERATEVSLSLTPEQAAEIGREELLKTMAADDVPQIARPMRERWREQLKSIQWKVQKRRVLRPVGPLRWNPAAIEASEDAVPAYMQMMRGYIKDFGSGVAHARRLDYAKEICRKTGSAIKDWMRSDPWWSAFLLKHRKQHIASVIDWGLGKLPYVAKLVHPALVGVLTRTVASQLQRPVSRDEMYRTAHAAREYETLLLCSHISQLVYSW
jgi:hypothetical protein